MIITVLYEYISVVILRIMVIQRTHRLAAKAVGESLFLI